MLTSVLVLFIAGILTVLLPCILPLLPIVLGVSIAGRSKWRPLLTVLGMVVSFVGFTFLLEVVLSQFPQFADALRIATYVALLLFGVGFLTDARMPRQIAALIGALFFVSEGWVAVLIAFVVAIAAVETGGWIASRLQQLGGDVQEQARSKLGAHVFLTSFVIGLTLGLVWVPCAGPALAFALTLVREQPGINALFLLTMYALGTALPLLIVGYGGQWAVHSVRALSRVSGRIKQIAGALLILSAFAFQFGWFTDLQTWFVEHTGYGTLGTRIEESLFEDQLNGNDPQKPADDSALPVLGTVPELAGLSRWFNSAPLTMEGLKGKVVLVDFWTYSCINCIRTLPYMRGYWDKYADTGKFVILGIHTPEFAFEKVPKNVQAALKKYGLQYPVALDNDFGTWNAFSNRYWPAKYLIDAEGRVRYTHFGEGEYEETDAAIGSLLAEAGVETGAAAEQPMPPAAEPSRLGRTPEIYLSERSWEAFANSQLEPSAEAITYTAPSSIPLHSYALVGTWQLADDERQVLQSDSGEILLHFLGSEANLVMGSTDEGRIEADVIVDGGKPRPFKLTGYDLYPLFQGEYGDHELRLRIRGKGAEAYAFTFGSASQ